MLSLAEENVRAGAARLDCVRASEQCLKEHVCSSKYRTMRQCVAGGKESNFSMVAGLEAKDECRSAMDALKQSPLYNCRCKRGMKKEKNCLRIYWGIYQTLQGWFSASGEYQIENRILLKVGYMCCFWSSVREWNKTKILMFFFSPGHALTPTKSLGGLCLDESPAFIEHPAAMVNVKWTFTLAFLI